MLTNVGTASIVLASTKVDRGLEFRSGQSKNYKIGICNCSAKHAAIETKSEILIMCPSGATCISADCFSELAL